VALDDRRFRIRSVDVKGALHRPKLFFCAANRIFPLETFFCFSNFSSQKGGSEGAMAMGELFTITALISIALMIAAYWQSDDGGLV
jgi:hypothetical protein